MVRNSNTENNRVLVGISIYFFNFKWTIIYFLFLNVNFYVNKYTNKQLGCQGCINLIKNAVKTVVLLASHT